MYPRAATTWATVSRGSVISTSKTVRPSLPNSDCRASIEGNSLVQCGHQVAQKYSMTSRPRKC